MSSCTLTRPSPSSTGPRRRRELAGAAADLGYPAFALTDHDGVWGSMEFVARLQGAGDPGDHRRRGDGGLADAARHLTLLVEDASGYRNLCRLLTAAHSHTRDSSQRQRRAAVGDARAGRGARRGAGLPLGVRGRRECLPPPGSGATRRRERRPPGRLLGAFGRDRFRIELQRPFWRRDRSRNRWLAGLAERLGVPAVATGNVHSHDQAPRPPAGRLRRDAAGDDAGGVGAAAARQLELGAGFAAADGGALRRAPRRRRRDPAARRAARVRPRPGARLPLPARRGAGGRPRAGRALPGAAGERYAGSAAPAQGRGASSRRSWRRSAPSASPASSSSTTTCSSSPARSPPRCGAADSARSILPPGRGRGSSVSSIVCYLTGLSHIDPVANDLNSSRFLNEEVGQAGSGRRCPTSTSTSRATSARC